jgi:hypothetical protein
VTPTPTCLWGLACSEVASARGVPVQRWLARVKHLRKLNLRSLGCRGAQHHLQKSRSLPARSVMWSPRGSAVSHAEHEDAVVCSWLTRKALHGFVVRCESKDYECDNKPARCFTFLSGVPVYSLQTISACCFPAVCKQCKALAAERATQSSSLTTPTNTVRPHENVF